MIALMPCAGMGIGLTGSRYKETYLVGGRPLIGYALDTAIYAGCRDLVLVMASGKEEVSWVASAWNFERMMTVYQKAPHGTGHAVSLLADLAKPGQTFLYLMPDTVHTGMPEALRGRHYPSDMRTPPVAEVFLWDTDQPERMGVFLHDGGLVIDHCEKKSPPWAGPYKAWGAAILSYEFVVWAADAWKSGEWKRYAMRNRGNANEFTIDDAYDYVLNRGMKIAAHEVDGWYVDCGTMDRVDLAERLIREARGDEADRG